MTTQNKYINILYIYNIYIIKIVVNFLSTTQQTVYCLFVCVCLLRFETAMIHTEKVDTLPRESLTLLLKRLTLTNCHPSFVIAFNVL